MPEIRREAVVRLLLCDDGELDHQADVPHGVDMFLADGDVFVPDRLKFLRLLQSYSHLWGGIQVLVLVD